MTGYGRGQSEHQGCRVTVEIRSVNHRFLDIKLRGAALDPATEEKLRGAARAKLTRGAVTVATRIDSQSRQSELRIDSAAARRAHNELRSLSGVLGLDREIPLALICSQPGVMVAGEVEDNSEAVSIAVTAAAKAAVEDLLGMRETEGKALKGDVQARLEVLAALAKQLSELAKDSPAEAQRRLNERLERLLKNSKVQVDDARLAQEVAIAADRLDVTEELVRVESHLQQIHEILAQETSIGRRLDFLVQELGREFNTVTSKSQSAEIARAVVEAKAEMEKIREQVQNIE